MMCTLLLTFGEDGISKIYIMLKGYIVKCGNAREMCAFEVRITLENCRIEIRDGTEFRFGKCCIPSQLRLLEGEITVENSVATKGIISNCRFSKTHKSFEYSVGGCKHLLNF